MKSIRLTISGDVQGVGFRSWFKHEAEKLQLVGFVKNKSDGTVEAVIQGDEEAIETMIINARKGPMTAWVTEVDLKELAINQSLTVFDVIY